MMDRISLLFKCLLLWCLCICLTGVIPGRAFAQDDDEFILEEVVVTGSRIVRNNQESSSPIVTVDEDLFAQSANLSIETQLNKLPQFSPTLDIPTSGGDIQPNATNTPGSATVALRGIGANRTLVLINGRRGTPANALGVVDINTIPAAALEYVEVISGGASSVYGADAMAGVLNFIMRDDFVGFELDVQAGMTQEGDNEEYQVSGIIGSSLADDRGNVSLAFSYNDRNEAFRRDRDWYRDQWADPSIGGNRFFSPFSGINVEYSNLPDLDVVNSVIDGATFTSVPGGVEIFDDGNGNAFSGIGYRQEIGTPGASGANFIDGVHYFIEDNGHIGQNYIDDYLILPLERWNTYTRGNYEINDWLGVFAQAYFSRVETLTVQQPVPIHGGNAVYIDPTINRDVIPAELLAILDSRSDPDAEFRLKGALPFPRRSETDVFTYNMVAGLEGEIPAIDWTWEIYGSRGEAETVVFQRGLLSMQRYRAVMTGGPNFGEGFSQTSNEEFGFFGGSTGTCTSGLNPFDWGSVTPDCWDAVTANVKTRQLMRQTIWEANAQGPIIELPAGEMRGAIGASYRENEYEFQNETLTTDGMSFLEQAIGLYPSGNSEGTIDVKEFYGELLVPVLSDLPFIKELNLELGGRSSDYNTTGNSLTYKAALDWRTTDWLRLRSTFNRAERAPNIAELFLAPLQVFAYVAGGDVCSTKNQLSYSANPEENPNNWQDVVELCGQLMKASGDPTADSGFYGVTYQEVMADPNSVTTNQLAGGSFLFPTTVGNPNLEPETADTWTLGVVIDSPFENPWISDFRISADYYKIEIEDAIGEQSGDVVMQQCVDPTFNPTYDINSPFCAGFNRNADGAIGNLKRSYFNNGRFETSGIDLSIDWGVDMGTGRLGVKALINYLIDKKSAELDSLPLVDYAGTFGPTQNGLNGNSYEWRSLVNVSYDFANSLRLTVRWIHLPEIRNAGAAITPDTPITGAPKYDTFDLLGSYQLLDNLHMRFGVENVFNEEPPLTGVNTTAELPTLSGGSFNAQNYDTNGRRFYLGARISF